MVIVDHSVSQSKEVPLPGDLWCRSYHFGYTGVESIIKFGLSAVLNSSIQLLPWKGIVGWFTSLPTSSGQPMQGQPLAYGLEYADADPRKHPRTAGGSHFCCRLLHMVRSSNDDCNVS